MILLCLFLPVSHAVILRKYSTIQTKFSDHTLVIANSCSGGCVSRAPQVLTGIVARPHGLRVEVSMYPLNDLFMSKIEQVESELRKLSQAELRQIREWLDDVIEDELQFTPEFESSIRQSEHDMASGKSARVREP
jgi:hypothetical protein